MTSHFATLISVLMLAGCASMSGYDARTSFACKAPDGVLCESMSGIYANASAKNLPGQRNARDGRSAAQPGNDGASGNAVLTLPIASGTPIRSAPQVLRVWLAPWEDADGDLHDQSYLYLAIDSGHWLIDHNRRRIAEAYRPVRAAEGRSSIGNDRPGGNLAPASDASDRTNVEMKPASDGRVPTQGLQPPASASGTGPGPGNEALRPTIPEASNANQ